MFFVAMIFFCQECCSNDGRIVIHLQWMQATLVWSEAILSLDSRPTWAVLDCCRILYMGSSVRSPLCPIVSHWCWPFSSYHVVWHRPPPPPPSLLHGWPHAFVCLCAVFVSQHAVGNTIKRVVIIVAACIAFRTPMTPLAIVGSSLAVGGTLVYSLVKAKYEKK